MFVDSFRRVRLHVALLGTAPILLLVMARPELLDRRPSWPVAPRLEPLAESEVETLIGGRVSRETETQILPAAGGNPLFVQELLAMVADGTAVALYEAKGNVLGAAHERVRTVS